MIQINRPKRGLAMLVCFAVGMQVALHTARAEGDSGDLIAKGKALAFEQKKGNCLACHMIEGGDSPGTIAPPLIAMKSRFPDVEHIRAQIDDARVKNPETSMPPFGKFKILNDEELDAVAAFIYSL